MKYSLSSRPGRGLTLTLSGELDINAVDGLRAVFERIVGLEVRHIEINLRGLRMIDSFGVGALIGFYKRIRTQGGEVVLGDWSKTRSCRPSESSPRSSRTRY